MKKIIATILTAAMIMSLTSCSGLLGKEKDSEEETKKTKTETTTETEETTEDTTSETSESETEIEPSETTEDPAPTTSPDPVSDCQYLRGNVESRNLAHGYRYDSGAVVDFSLLLIEQEAYYSWPSEEGTDIEVAVNAIMQPKFDMCRELYDSYLAQFHLIQSPMSTYIAIQTAPYRADDQILSFGVMMSPDQPENTPMGYNFYCPTCELLTFDDVVLDKDAFKAFCEGETDPYTYSMIANQIDDGSIQFAMTYNGVVLLLSYVSKDTINETTFYFPVYGHEEIFNMEYFGTTPYAFTLFPDCHGEILWDLDGDEKIESAQVIGETDDYDTGLTIKINFGDVTYNSNRDLPDSYGTVENYCLLYDGRDWYAHVYIMEDENEPYIYVFKLGDEITYQGLVEGAPVCTTFINPQDYTIGNLEIVLGKDVLLKKCANCLNSDGIPRVDQYNYATCYDAPYFVKSDLAGSKVSARNDFDNPIKDMNISPGNCFVLHAVSEDGYIIVEVLREDPADNVFIRLPYSNEGGVEKICDMDIIDALIQKV